jgi:hypothetical protein
MGIQSVLTSRPGPVPFDSESAESTQRNLPRRQQLLKFQQGVLSFRVNLLARSTSNQVNPLHRSLLYWQQEVKYEFSALSFSLDLLSHSARSTLAHGAAIGSVAKTRRISS